MDIKKARRDSKAISAGQWVGEIPEMGNLRLKVRGMSDPAVQNHQNWLTRQISRDRRRADGTLLPEAAREVVAQTYVDMVLLDWENVEFNGEVVEYSKERAGEWLFDPDYLAFNAAIAYASGVVDRSLHSGMEEEEISGN